MIVLTKISGLASDRELSVRYFDSHGRGSLVPLCPLFVNVPAVGGLRAHAQRLFSALECEEAQGNARGALAGSVEDPCCQEEKIMLYGIYAGMRAATGALTVVGQAVS
jgi:hypothetical protein